MSTAPWLAARSSLLKVVGNKGARGVADELADALEGVITTDAGELREGADTAVDNAAVKVGTLEDDGHDRPREGGMEVNHWS